MGLKFKWFVLNFAIFIILINISGCGNSTSFAPVINGIYQAKNGIYTAQSGDSLYSIAWNFGKDYRTLARANGLVPPYAIRPGQRLIINPARLKKAAIIKPRHSEKIKRFRYKLSTAPLIKNNRRKHSVNKTYVARKVTRYKKPGYRYKKLAKVTHWRWPASGKIVDRFSPKNGNKGVDIANHSGTSVYAAASGRVVYRGSGLPGYGKLIIIKHNSEYLSAYAHNRRLLVREGQMVKSGQKIAEMGHTGSKRNMLHFEMRRAGKPVNPLLYLPKK